MYIYISNYIYIYIYLRCVQHVVWDGFGGCFAFLRASAPYSIGVCVARWIQHPKNHPKIYVILWKGQRNHQWQMVNIPWFCLGFIRFQPSFWWCRISQPHRDFFCEWQATYSHDSHGPSARPTAEEQLFFPHHPHLRATQRSSTFGSFQAPLLVQAGFHPSLLTYLHTAHGPKQKKHNMHHSIGLSDALWSR